MHLPPALTALTKALSKLPGLGPRSAQRVALQLALNPAQLQAVQQALAVAENGLTRCPSCGNLAEVGREEGPHLCPICADGSRDATRLCVVEQVADIWALERSGAYKGRYHVLGGVVSALQGVAPDDLTLASLEARLQATSPSLQEVIVALGASLEGQTTTHLVALTVQRAAPGAKLTTLAKGMPVGASVDYLDEGTLGLALAHRQSISA